MSFIFVWCFWFSEILHCQCLWLRLLKTTDTIAYIWYISYITFCQNSININLYNYGRRSFFKISYLFNCTIQNYFYIKNLYKKKIKLNTCIIDPRLYIVIIEALFDPAYEQRTRSLTQPTRALVRHLLEKNCQVFYTSNLVLNRHKWLKLWINFYK